MEGEARGGGGQSQVLRFQLLGFGIDLFRMIASGGLEPLLQLLLLDVHALAALEVDAQGPHENESLVHHMPEVVDRLPQPLQRNLHAPDKGAALLARVLPAEHGARALGLGEVV